MTVLWPSLINMKEIHIQMRANSTVIKVGKLQKADVTFFYSNTNNVLLRITHSYVVAC